MALKAAERLSAAYLDLKELAEDGPVLAIFRLREFLDAEPGDFGPILPVIADILVVDHPELGGKVFRNETFKMAITSALRGVRNPKKGDPVPAPVNEVGDEIVVRVKVMNPGKGNAGAVGDKPSPSELKLAQAAYDQLGGKALWDAADWPAAPAQPVAAVPVQGGVGATPPWMQG